MTIHLPVELERSIRSLVLGGRFASDEEVVSEALRTFLARSDMMPSTPVASETSKSASFIGSMREAADELDEIVADAMRDRSERPWRLNPVE